MKRLIRWTRRAGDRTSTRRRDERGAAMVTVMLIMVIVSSVVAVAAVNAVADLGRASAQIRRATALQAAEAGVADYVAKLVEDRLYYLHYVHPAESTRRPPTGATVGASGAWGGAATWTYPTPFDAWRAMPNGYEYNLTIQPPTQAAPLLTIVATGRRQASTKELRRIEVTIRPSSIADFLLISNGGVNYRSDAVTRGKVYAGRSTTVNANGSVTVTPQNIDHPGTAYGDLLAEGQVINVSSSRLLDGARAIDSDSIQTSTGTTTGGFTTPPIRSELRNPINFNLFTDSMTEVRTAAGTPSGVLIDDPAVQLWELVFNANATITRRKCTYTQDVLKVAPSCTSPPTTLAMPANGAIYVGQSTIVRGVIDGQATLVTNGDIIFGADLTYEQRGNDVIGLIARNGLRNPWWVDVGDDKRLTVHAAMIAQQDTYGCWGNSDPRFFQLHHIGSVASAGRPVQVYWDINDPSKTTGCIGGVRTYEYDENLRFLQPPFYPALEDAYAVSSFRELTAPSL